MSQFLRNYKSICFFKAFYAMAFVLFIHGFLLAGISIEGDDTFRSNVTKELQSMREGKRGLVPQTLIERLDISTAATTIKPITNEEETWHPNDRKGTRSFVVPVDTKIRGGQRNVPTGAIVYIHPNRVDPSLSLYRLGTFAYQLAVAADLNRGEFSGDYKIREKRAVFFRNAWCDSLKYSVIDVSGRIPTKEYQTAKSKGLINDENKDRFPILETP
jgi:hypothetical protein